MQYFLLCTSTDKGSIIDCITYQIMKLQAAMIVNVLSASLSKGGNGEWPTSVWFYTAFSLTDIYLEWCNSNRVPKSLLFELTYQKYCSIALFTQNGQRRNQEFKTIRGDEEYLRFGGVSTQNSWFIEN